MPRRMVGRKSARGVPERPRPGDRVARPGTRVARRRPRPRPVRKGPSGPPVFRLVAWPALVTLAVTLLRLGGERLGWSQRYFSTVAGGGLAWVGIAWLVPLAGAYFGYRLAWEGATPRSLTRALMVPLATVLVVFALVTAGSRLESTGTFQGYLALWGVASIIGCGLALWAWPLLGRALVLYAMAARIPVVAVMWFAIQGEWGTHYDAPPPGFPVVPPMTRFLWTAVLPQMTVWVAYTVVVGALFGVVGLHLALRRPE